MLIKAVIFDFNGVIVRDVKYHYLSWKEFLASKHIKVNPETLPPGFFGWTDKNILNYFLKKNIHLGELIKLSNQRLKLVYKILPSKLRPTPGLLELLTNLKRKNILLAIASCSRKSYVNKILKKVKLRNFFYYILTAENISKSKPDSEIYQKMALLIEVDPQDCLVFEDSLSGIKSAQRAGMKVVALTRTHKKAELLAIKPIKIIDNFINFNLKDITN